MNPPSLDSLKLDRPLAEKPPRKKSLRVALIAGALALAAGLVLTLRGGGETVVEVATVTTAYPYQNAAVQNAAGFVVPQRKAAVSTKATGRLEWLGVQEGSQVKENDIIARLDNRDVRAQADQAQANVTVARAAIGQAEAEYTDARAALERSRELKARNFISQATLDTANARHTKAQALLASARAALTAAQAGARAAEVAVEQTLIRAPFDGVVLTKNANVGDILTPFSSAAESKGAVVTMADMRTLEVEADISEANLASIKVGQPVEIVLDALPDERFRGQVSRLVPTVDRTKATVMTKVSFIDHDPRVLPDMAARVVFLSRPVTDDERKPRTVVLHAALTVRDGKTVVFALSGTTAHARLVTEQGKIGDAVIVTPAKPGERVVLNPPTQLQDGDRVRLAKPQP